MNKATHVLLGKHLYAYLRDVFGVYLDRESFLLGNVLPDLYLTFLIKPHLFKNYSPCIKSVIQNLLNIKQSSALFGKSYSKQLGIICHYFADFFCYPHRQDYSGDLVAHGNYEKDLYRYLQCDACISPEQLMSSEWQADANERILFSSLSKLQESYLQQDPSFEIDITYSIKACSEALIRITSASLIEQTDEYELCYLA